MLHCGAELVELESLKTIELPEETRTYKPVSHYDLVMNTMHSGDIFLKPQGYNLESTNFGLGREGKHMFFTLNYGLEGARNGLTIGGRNSYDKSTSIGLAAGMHVFVCDNLAFSGDQVTYLRKHTGNVEDDMEIMLMRIMKSADNEWKNMDKLTNEMASTPMSDSDAYKKLGLLYGNGVLTPRQLPIVKSEWKDSKYEDFKDKNMWSFYNACTEALKSSPPNQMLNRHIKLHKELVLA
tara:strand:- start:467 stop:1180 length:714 start_codon:yes stop_codon:yes gene_type:complete